MSEQIIVNGTRLPGKNTISIDLSPEFRHLPVAEARKDAAEESSFLSDYLWLINRQKWKIAAFVVMITIATAYISSRLTPVYQSTATVELDRGAPMGIVGRDSQMPVGGNDTDQFMATQIKLIQAPSVLRRVIEKYDPEAVSGKGLEKIPEEERPMGLRNLSVIRPGNTYILQIGYRHPNAKMAARVANEVAQSYVDHTYEIRYDSLAGLSKFMEKQLNDLRARMQKSAAALADFERQFQLIDPEQKTSIVSARLLQLNTEYTAAQSDRVRKETAYNSVKSGSMDAAFVSSQSEEMRKLQDSLNEAQQKFVQTKTQLGVNHPEYRQAASLVTELQKQIEVLRNSAVARAQVQYEESLAREHMIEKVLSDTRSDFDQLNAHSFRYKSLKLDAEGDKKLYDELLHKIQESSINSGFQNSAIRLADPAVPGLRPVYPNIPLNVAMAFLLSTIFAVGAVIVSETFDNTVHDPIHVKRVGSQMLGSLPTLKIRSTSRQLLALPEIAADDETAVAPKNSRNTRQTAFSEKIRAIRESILLSDPDHPIRTLLVTSSSAKEGKSTFATHLAVSSAMQNIKTLLVDADLRHPSAHLALGVANNAGLGHVIRTQQNWRELLQQVPGVPDLEFLAAGSPSPRAFDLLGTILAGVLEYAYRDYGLIVIDSPPILGFAESLKTASLADGVVVVARSKVTHRKALQAGITLLEQVNARVVGVVLNQVDEHTSRKYYYSGYYA